MPVGTNPDAAPIEPILDYHFTLSTTWFLAKPRSLAGCNRTRGPVSFTESSDSVFKDRSTKLGFVSRFGTLSFGSVAAFRGLVNLAEGLQFVKFRFPFVPAVSAFSFGARCLAHQRFRSRTFFRLASLLFRAAPQVQDSGDALDSSRGEAVKLDPVDCSRRGPNPPKLATGARRSGDARPAGARSRGDRRRPPGRPPSLDAP